MAWRRRYSTMSKNDSPSSGVPSIWPLLAAVTLRCRAGRVRRRPPPRARRRRRSRGPRSRRRRVLVRFGRHVGHLVGQPLVEGLVVLGLDPPLGRIGDLVAVVVADLVGVECLGLATAGSRRNRMWTCRHGARARRRRINATHPRSVTSATEVSWRVDTRTDLAAELFATVGPLPAAGPPVGRRSADRLRPARVAGRAAAAGRSPTRHLGAPRRRRTRPRRPTPRPRWCRELSADGLLVRTVDPDDRRVGRLRLTESAQRIADESRAVAPGRARRRARPARRPTRSSACTTDWRCSPR